MRSLGFVRSSPTFLLCCVCHWVNLVVPEVIRERVKALKEARHALWRDDERQRGMQPGGRGRKRHRNRRRKGRQRPALPNPECCPFPHGERTLKVDTCSVPQASSGWEDYVTRRLIASRVAS